MSKHPEEYLGDGLYASFDGFQFALRAPRDGGDHVVYLDLSVVKAFQRYVDNAVKQLSEAAFGVSRGAEGADE